MRETKNLKKWELFFTFYRGIRPFEKLKCSTCGDTFRIWLLLKPFKPASWLDRSPFGAISGLKMDKKGAKNTQNSDTFIYLHDNHHIIGLMGG